MASEFLCRVSGACGPVRPDLKVDESMILHMHICTNLFMVSTLALEIENTTKDVKNLNACMFVATIHQRVMFAISCLLFVVSFLPCGIFSEAVRHCSKL